MYCPNCGIETLNNKRFCRGCGMDLQLIFQALSGQPPQTSTDTLTESPRKKTRRIGFITMLGGLVLAMLLSILGGAFSNLDDSLGSFFASLSGLGGLVFTIGIGIMIYSLFLSKTPAISHTSQYDAIPPTQPHMQMPPAEFGQRVSVTENTTELLDQEDNHARLHR